MVLRALRPFASHPDVAQVVLVLPPDRCRPAARLSLRAPGVRDLTLALAGGRRARAIRCAAGSPRCAPECTMVLVHDGARPFVDARVIDAVIALRAAGEGAVAAVPVSDTLKEAAADEPTRVRAHPVPRDGLWRAQTPQGFPRATARAGIRSGPRDWAAAHRRRRAGRANWRDPVRLVPDSTAQPQGHHAGGSRPRGAARRQRPDDPARSGPTTRSTPPFPHVGRASRAPAGCWPIPPKPSTAWAPRPPCPRSTRSRGSRAASRASRSCCSSPAGAWRRSGAWCSPRRPARCRTRSGPVRSRWCFAAARGSLPDELRGREGGIAVRHTSHRRHRAAGGATRPAAHLHLRQSSRRPSRARAPTGWSRCSGRRSGTGELLVLDGGVLGNVPPSTLVDCTDAVPRLVREGRAFPRGGAADAAARAAGAMSDGVGA